VNSIFTAYVLFYFCSDPRWIIFLYRYVSIWNSCNDYFCKQADLNDSETSVPDITDILINGLEQITITENEVEDILKILDTSKAIGPDLLNIK
jgi:hypothetical protein